MARGRGDYEDPEEAEDEEYADLEEEEEDYGGGKDSKRRRSQFVDDVAEEDDDEEEEEDDGDDDFEFEERGSKRRPSKRSRVASLIDDEAIVDSDDEEEEEDEGEDGFIVDNGADIPDEDGARQMRQRPMYDREDDFDVDNFEEYVRQKYVSRTNDLEYEETTDVEQQALLPSVRDPKLFMVKCGIGKEREVAVCLMQKFMDKGDLQIRSAIALDHLKNYIYIEADKESHVREAIKGMRSIFGSNITIVPIKEMTDVLSVESKSNDIARDAWVRVKSGTYKGDLAKVVDVDNVKQRVTVKLIPRIDLQADANKLDGREVTKKKQFVPPPRLLNIEEARDLHIPVERRKDHVTGEYFEKICGKMFKDGFYIKTMSMKTVSTQNIQPTFDELEKFRQPSEGDGDISGLSTLFANRKRGHFMKGDAVIVVKGDLKNLKGWAEKVEDGHVHIRPNAEGLPKTLSINEKDLCKYFEPGNHVKVVSGAQEGATGMVLKVEGHVLIILSDTTKEDIRVFADYVVESSEVTTGITRIGIYELHDLVLLDNKSFGVIIRIETEAFRVLKGIPDRSEVVLVRIREIKSKIDKKLVAHDRERNTVSVKDIVRVCEGPCQGKQGPVEHIFRGILFIYDRHHLEHTGFICAKSQSCRVVGGSHSNRDKPVGSLSYMRPPQRIPQSPGRFSPRDPMNSGGRYRGGGGRGGGRGQDSLVGKTVKIRLGPYKGHRGRVKDVKSNNLRIELDSTMKDVIVDRNHVTDNVTILTTPHRDTSRYSVGSETPMHPSRTPMHPFMTPMRDPGATPIHDGMRTPMHDRAWNPYAPTSPARDNWDDANPATWGTTPQYRPGSPPSRTYDAPTPGSGYNDVGTRRDSNSAYSNAPSPYLPSTPGQPTTPSSALYLPSTPAGAGQPMTPGGGLDVMSPAIGGENDGLVLIPDILVTVHRPGDDAMTGVVRDVLPDGSCRVLLGSAASGEMITVLPNEAEVVEPRKSDKIKILGGAQRGYTGKLIGIDGTDGIVKVDESLDVKILNMAYLGKVALP